MSSSKSLAALTRSLVVGSSIGAIAVAGACVPVPGQQGTGATPASSTSSGALTVSSQAEADACMRAINERSVAALNDLISRFPGSVCIAPIFNALPSRTLAALSPEAVRGISPEVFERLSAPARGALPVQRVAAAPESRGPGLIRNDY